MSKIPASRNVLPEVGGLTRADASQISKEAFDLASRYKVIAYYHSHPSDPAEPSGVDKSAMRKTGVPMWIYSVPERKLSKFRANELWRTLLGRPYRYGDADCGTLVKDYYEWICGLSIEDAHRPEKLLRPKTLVELALSRGFRQLEDAEPWKLHDGALIFPTCFAVYVGDGQLLYHPDGALSQVSNIDEVKISSRWRNSELE